MMKLKNNPYLQFMFTKEEIKKYKQLGVSKKTLKQLNQQLKLPDVKLSSFARPRRREALYEALSWEKGFSQTNRKIKEVYKIGRYRVGVAKPGKEAAPDYKGCRHYITGEKTNNPNDMYPFILKSRREIAKGLSFGDIFGRIEKLMHADIFGLELMGTLLFRSAFMLDHKKNKDGNWRCSYPKDVLADLEKRISHVSEIPTRAFLYFLDILALNEDVKMHTLGYTDLPYDYGRINTLLTLAHLVAVFLNRRSLAKFAGTLARPPSGMSPMPKTDGAIECYPLLSG